MPDDPLGVGAQGGTQPSQINDSGQIVGGYFDATGLGHGYLQIGNQYTKVDDPAGVQGNFANGINDAGQIVGDYVDATGLEHGYLATPLQGDFSSVQVATSLASSPSADVGRGLVSRSAGPSLDLTMVGGATSGHPLQTVDANRVGPLERGGVCDLGAFPLESVLVLASDPAWATNGLTLP